MTPSGDLIPEIPTPHKLLVSTLDHHFADHYDATGEDIGDDAQEILDAFARAGYYVACGPLTPIWGVACYEGCIHNQSYVKEFARDKREGQLMQAYITRWQKCSEDEKATDA